ncbi:MAG: transcriptional regulator [Micrococcales bacterium]|nr:MAG: transcriptional regulator [Micrococcales bacterium]
MTIVRRPRVRLLRWPAESSVREKCENERVPRILVVEGGSSPPIPSDQFEDWVRQPISPVDLNARIEALERLADQELRPTLDPFGALTFNQRSIAVSLVQTGLLEELVQRYGRVVSREVLSHRLAKARQSVPSRNSLDLHMMRLRRRLADLELTITTAWGRGYVLEPCQTP